MKDHTAIGAYASETPSGWTAYDKAGLGWPVAADEAQRLEAAREARVNSRRKGASDA